MPDAWIQAYVTSSGSTSEDISFASEDEAPAGTRALLYLRVSTKRQIDTDFDPEGISLPAQRVACLRKAEQLGLNVIGEYVEPGRSGTEMTKRVEFQEMLTRIRRERDVDYVVVYELARFARNRLDDAIVMADLKKRGVTLVSATESIDDTPVGQLMHGILAAFNEYRSRKDGADVAYKMGEKAKKGGTLGQAPLGYLNVMLQTEDGRKIRTVEIDPVRGPLVRQAFELYATGDYSTLDVEEVMKTRGLLTRRSPKRIAQPVTHKAWAKMFRNRYYVGIVTYKGQEEIPGRHEPLVDEVVFERVQRLLDEHGVAGERRRVNHHHLKGSLYCGRCHGEGLVRRQIVQRSPGRHGEDYWYFFCIGNQRGGGCQSPHNSADRVEEAVVEHYKTIAFSPDFIARMKIALDQMLAESDAAQRLYRKQLQDQLKELEIKETNLIELAADGTMPQARIKTRLTEIGREREKLQTELSGVVLELTTGVEFLTACLELMRNPHELYRQSSDKVRRGLNQAIFKRIFVFNEEVTGHELQPHLAELRAIEAGQMAVERGQGVETAAHIARSVLKRHLPETELATRKGGERMMLIEALASKFLGHVSSTALMVRPKGFEPLTS
ncbi:recombinase family protein [Nocardia salmonicida]|uniref:recombinase family protein n=1 Tax=Nocardia salmonicida TaxID=53431 RepID=UPI0033F118BD